MSKNIFLMILTFIVTFSPCVAGFEEGELCTIIKGPDQGQTVRIMGSCKTKYFVNNIFEFFQKSPELLEKWGLITINSKFTFTAEYFRAVHKYFDDYLRNKEYQKRSGVIDFLLNDDHSFSPTCASLIEWGDKETVKKFLEEADGEFYVVRCPNTEIQFIHASWLEKAEGGKAHVAVVYSYPSDF